MSLLQSAARQTLEVSLAVSVVILALLCLRPVLGKRYRAKAFYWIWLILALRLAVPLNPSLPQAPVRLAVPDPVLYAEAEGAAPPALHPAEPSGAEIVPPSALAETARPVPEGRRLTLGMAASVLWAVGCSVFLAAQLAAYARFRRKVRRWSRPLAEGEALFEALRRELGAGEVALAVCPAVPSPLMTGLLRPVLLLPEEQYTPQELTAIFHHELIHARRRDLWYKLLLLLARSVHWFNPLVYSMARRAEQDLEISCDEAVVAGRSSAFQAQYGRAVLSAAGREPVFYAPLTSRFKGGKEIMRERMRAVAGKNGQRRGVLVICAAALLATAAAAVCSFGGSGPEPPQPLESPVAAGPEELQPLQSAGAVIYEEMRQTLAPVSEPYVLPERLKVRDLPVKPAELSNLRPGDFWEGLLVPVAHDAGTGFTVYAAALPDALSGAGGPYELNNALDRQRLILRCGERLVSCAIEWDAWFAGNPALYVGDFNGDGAPEAAVNVNQGHGTGVSVYNLYIFDLNTLSCSVPELSGLCVTAAFDDDTATLTAGGLTLTVEPAAESLGRHTVYYGTVVYFAFEEGQLLCRLALDFSGYTADYLADVEAPVVWADGRYRLGAVQRLADADEFQFF